MASAARYLRPEVIAQVQRLDLKARFIVEGTLPPEDHWETEDPQVQAGDRYVEMTLITVGR